MIALVIVLGCVSVLLAVAAFFARAAAQRQTEIAAKALAESFAREAQAAAQRKVNAAAMADTKEIDDATHEELLRRARTLAGRD